MSTTITRHCDHCKQEIPEKNKGQIWKVQLLVTNEENYRANKLSALNLYMTESNNRQDWCRPCIDKFNLLNHAWTPPKDAPDAQPPSFEDQLREVIRDEIQASQS